MLKKIQRQKSSFERYFMEADDEPDNGNVSVTVAPRNNRGTDYAADDADTTNVTVAPRNNRGTDYATDETPEQDTAEDTTGPDTGEDDGGTDYTADAGDGGDTADTGDGGGEDTAQDDGGGPDTGDEDGGTDYSADGGDTADTGDGGGEDNNDTNTEENQEDTDEKNKKFHMYKRYIRLYNTIESFSEKLRDVVKNDASQNSVIKVVCNNLNDVHDNLYDYMTIKYKNASYVQILIYFETVISIIRLNFELLRNNKINLKQ